MDQLSHDRLTLRRALGTFVTGVTVVTTMDGEGNPRGMTANSFTSVSLEPPLALVCIDQAARSHDAFTSGDGLGIHVLAHDQEELASRFATKAPDKFAGLDCRRGAAGAPIFPDCAAWLDCEITERIPLGDHTALVALVRDFSVQPRRPLGFFQGRFIPLAPDVEGLADGAGGVLVAGWLADAPDGRLILERARDADGGERWTIPGSALPTASLDDASLAAAARERLGLEAAIEFLYSIFDDPGRRRVILVYRVTVSSEAVAGVRPPMAAFAIDDLPWDEIRPASIRSTLERYVRERSAARFGLYAGSSERGRVAALGDVALDH